MKQIDLEKELRILESNVIHQSKINSIQSLQKRSIMTFHPQNWLITFPYNYIQNTKNDIELVRKLSIINALYVSYFLREDDVIDEYHLSLGLKREIIVKMLEAHISRNLAIGQLHYLCNKEIFNYIFRYEKDYYTALIFEKDLFKINVDNMFDLNNLNYLGNKLMPIAITYTAYCLINESPRNIPICEQLIFNYHIAKQLYDDIIDLEEDIKKPDLSYTIKIIKEYLKKDDITVYEINNVLQGTGLYIKIIKTAQHYLKVSKKYAKELNFLHFRLKINDLEKKLKNLKY